MFVFKHGCTNLFFFTLKEYLISATAIKLQSLCTVCMWSQADAFFLWKVVSWASCALLLHVGLLLINKTQIRAWHVKLVSCKGPVIKQISSGIKRVINADDQHSPSDELGLGESQGATVGVVLNFIRVQGLFQMCPFAANAFLGFKKLKTVKIATFLCKLKILWPSHSYQMQNISLCSFAKEKPKVSGVCFREEEEEMQRVPQICARGEGGSVASAAWQPQPLRSEEMSRLSHCVSPQESSRWELLPVYTSQVHQGDSPTHLIMRSCVRRMHALTHACTAICNLQDQLLFTLTCGCHMRNDIYRRAS